MWPTLSRFPGPVAQVLTGGVRELGLRSRGEGLLLVAVEPAAIQEQLAVGVDAALRP